MKAHERKDRAWEMLRRGQHEDAAAEYEWLWRNIPGSAAELAPYRATTLVTEIRSLCEASPPAASRFERLRDEAHQQASASPAVDSDARLDWIILNDLLGHTADTVSWLDTQDLTPWPDRRLATFLQHMTPALVEHGRSKDIGRLQRAPIAMMRALQETVRLTMARSAMKASSVHDLATAELWRVFREQATVLYKSLVAAGRVAEAETIFDEAVQFDGNSDLAHRLVQAGAAVAHEPPRM